MLLSQGLAPEPLALTISIGAAVGTLPLLWGTTLLCVLLASRLRLNQAALQAVNYLLYPVQLALLVPLYRMGAGLFPWGPALPHGQVAQVLHGGFTSGATVLAVATLKAVGAWAITVIPLIAIMHPLLLALLRRKAVPAG
ncbi:DUF2062 domain-containing protein [Geomonas sp. Red875]|uniref:DUF2062 domain-containing protein n=2 Tax=Geomesophilobacter sediminis TaxID=2798584 RepID=A0A8J7JBF2_9BACT|nr:DUF2062 domain-containing protein [Geomesophilobacter sediminis]